MMEFPHPFILTVCSEISNEIIYIDNGIFLAQTSKV
jgi:hypothetical protein